MIAGANGHSTPALKHDMPDRHAPSPGGDLGSPASSDLPDRKPSSGIMSGGESSIDLSLQISYP